MSHSITFLRHADAKPAIDDINRPLSELGKSQAIQRAKSLLGEKYDLVLISSALRTKQTAEIITEQIECEAPFITLDELYLCPTRQNHSAEEICKIIHQIESEKQACNILVVAHANIINQIGELMLPLASDMLKVHFSPTEGFCIKNDADLILIR